MKNLTKLIGISFCIQNVVFAELKLYLCLVLRIFLKAGSIFPPPGELMISSDLFSVHSACLTYHVVAGI